MSSLSVPATTLDTTESLADVLRRFGAKVLARKVRTSPRTTENWLARRAAPTWKHVVTMMNDDELCAALLEAAGRGDLARSAETIAKLRAALGAVEGK